jgi:hypothetical protein
MLQAKSFSPCNSRVGILNLGSSLAQSTSFAGSIVMIRSAASGVARDRMLTPQCRMCSVSGSGVQRSMNQRRRS